MIDTRLIIGNAIDSLPKDMAYSCTKKGYFLTIVEDSGKKYIIIDTTIFLELDTQKHHKKAMNLYSLFSDIEQWFNC